MVQSRSTASGGGTDDVWFALSSNISATGVGNVTIIGAGQNGFRIGSEGTFSNGTPLPASEINTNGGLITVTANSIQLYGGSQVNATSAGNVLIQTLGSDVYLGTTGLRPDLNLDSGLLSNITANLLTIGSNTTGRIINTAAISLNNLTLISGNSITQTGAGNLTVSGTANFVSSGSGTAGNITLGNATNDFGSVTANGTNITITDTNALTLGSIAGNGTIQITAQNVTINSTVNATSSGSVLLIPTSGTVVDLGTKSTGNFGLTSGEIGNITANLLTIGSNTTGNITLTNNLAWSSNLELQSSTAISGVLSNSNHTLTQAGNNITANGLITLGASNPLEVTSTANSGSGSLRDAIIYAASHAGDDTITFASSLANSTISLTSPITINDTGNLTISGLGASNLTIGGGDTTGLFSVLTTATLNNLIFANATGTGLTNGGAFYSNSSLNLENVVIKSSTASFGAAVYQSGGSLSIITSNIVNSIYVTGSGSLTITDTQSLSLGQITACSVTVSLSSGAISQSAGTNLTVSGTANFVAVGNITLNNATNDFGTVTANGTDVTINDINALVLDTITANNLTVGTGGDITQSGVANVTLTANLNSTANITLDQSNLFTTVLANGTNVTIKDADSVELGATTATNLTVTTVGAITQSAATTVTGISSLINSGTGTAGNITLNSGNDFGKVAASGTNVTVNDINAVVLGSTTATNLTVTTVGAITQSAAATVTGIASLTNTGSGAAGNITLDNAGNNFGTVTASGTNITVNELNDITIGAITATGDFTVQGDNTTSCISVTGPINATGGSGSVSLTGRNIEVTGDISTAAGGISLIGNNGTYQTGSFDGVYISGSNVDVNTSGGNIVIDGRGALNSVNKGVNLGSSSLQAGGSGCVTITGVSGNGSGNTYGIYAYFARVASNSGSLTVNGTSCGTGTNSRGIQLERADISSTNSGSVTLQGKSANGTNAAYGVFVTDQSSVTISSGTLTINGTSCGTTGDSKGVYLHGSSIITATGSGDIIVIGLAANGTTAAKGMDLEDSACITTNTGSITVIGTSCGTGSIDMAGVWLQFGANMSSTGGGNVSISGSSPGNPTLGFGIRYYDNQPVVYTNGGQITLTANSMDLVGTVNATTAGNVLIQTLGAGVNLGGADSSANLGLTRAEIGQITANKLTIGNSTTGNIAITDAITFGNLTLITGGQIEETGAGNLTASGTANFVAVGNITLNNATNAFGTVLANGTNVTINDINALALGTITATNLTVIAGGQITQSGGANVSSGTANFTSTAGIDLNDLTNDFGTILANGDTVTIEDINNGSYWIPGWSRIPLRYKILITVFTPHTRSILGQGRLDV